MHASNSLYQIKCVIAMLQSVPVAVRMTDYVGILRLIAVVLSRLPLPQIKLPHASTYYSCIGFVVSIKSVILNGLFQWICKYIHDYETL